MESNINILLSAHFKVKNLLFFNKKTTPHLRGKKNIRPKIYLYAKMNMNKQTIPLKIHWRRQKKSDAIKNSLICKELFAIDDILCDSS